MFTEDSDYDYPWQKKEEEEVLNVIEANLNEKITSTQLMSERFGFNYSPTSIKNKIK